MLASHVETLVVMGAYMVYRTEKPVGKLMDKSTQVYLLPNHSSPLCPVGCVIWPCVVYGKYH